MLGSMGGLFSKKHSSTKNSTRITDQDRAVLQLKQQRDKLKLYKRKIHAQLEQERLLAKRMLDEGKKE